MRSDTVYLRSLFIDLVEDRQMTAEFSSFDRISLSKSSRKFLEGGAKNNTSGKNSGKSVRSCDNKSNKNCVKKDFS